MCRNSYWFVELIRLTRQSQCHVTRWCVTWWAWFCALTSLDLVCTCSQLETRGNLCLFTVFTLLSRDTGVIPFFEQRWKVYWLYFAGTPDGGLLTRYICFRLSIFHRKACIRAWNTSEFMPWNRRDLDLLNSHSEWIGMGRLCWTIPFCK